MTLPNPKFATEYIDSTLLVPDSSNARKHPKAQLARLEPAIKEFGLCVPVQVDEKIRIIAGHARLIAAQALGMLEVSATRETVFRTST